MKKIIAMTAAVLGLTLVASLAIAACGPSDACASTRGRGGRTTVRIYKAPKPRKTVEVHHYHNSTTHVVHHDHC